jgi:hypothetical protein
MAGRLMTDLHSVHSVAVRASAEPRKQRRSRRRGEHRPSVRHLLVFDTETTTDETQALLYGCFRYCRVDGLTVTTSRKG